MARGPQGPQQRGRRYVCSPPRFTEPRRQLDWIGGRLAFSPTTCHLTGGVQILIVRRPYSGGRNSSAKPARLACTARRRAPDSPYLATEKLAFRDRPFRVGQPATKRTNHLPDFALSLTRDTPITPVRLSTYFRFILAGHGSCLTRASPYSRARLRAVARPSGLSEKYLTQRVPARLADTTNPRK